MFSHDADIRRPDSSQRRPQNDENAKATPLAGLYPANRGFGKMAPPKEKRGQVGYRAVIQMQQGFNAPRVFPTPVCKIGSLAEADSCQFESAIRLRIRFKGDSRPPITPIWGIFEYDRFMRLYNLRPVAARKQGEHRAADPHRRENHELVCRQISSRHLADPAWRWSREQIRRRSRGLW